jgi:hypothetical protein
MRLCEGNWISPNNIVSNTIPEGRRIVRVKRMLSAIGLNRDISNYFTVLRTMQTKRGESLVCVQHGLELLGYFEASHD